MASIRKRSGKWQVQVRRTGATPVSKTFNLKKDAEAWAKQAEIQVDARHLPKDHKILDHLALGELVTNGVAVDCQVRKQGRRTGNGRTEALSHGLS